MAVFCFVNGRTPTLYIWMWTARSYICIKHVVVMKLSYHIYRAGLTQILSQGWYIYEMSLWFLKRRTILHHCNENERSTWYTCDFLKILGPTTKQQRCNRDKNWLTGYSNLGLRWADKESCKYGLSRRTLSGEGGRRSIKWIMCISWRSWIYQYRQWVLLKSKQSGITSMR